MNSPQERIDEYFQRHDSAGVGRSPIRASEIRKLFTQTIAELEASCALKTELLRAVRYSMDRDVPFPSLEKITEAINDTGGKELLERLNELEKENHKLNKALALKLNKLEEQVWLESKESHERLTKLEDRLKTAAGMLRSAVYERTPLGDKWIDHFDVERQKAITEFLASVEGKP